ncbi:MAG: cupin domain-containing protein [Armatimonadota bacterium]
MKVASIEDEYGVSIASPYERTIKVLFAPDRRGVPELTFSHVTIPPGGGTDSHAHDRPELIYIVSGTARCASPDGAEVRGPGAALWAETGELHELRNAGDEPLTIVTVFVPPYRAEQLYAACLERAAAASEEESPDV